MVKVSPCSGALPASLAQLAPISAAGCRLSPRKAASWCGKSLGQCRPSFGATQRSTRSKRVPNMRDVPRCRSFFPAQHTKHPTHAHRKRPEAANPDDIVAASNM